MTRVSYRDKPQNAMQETAGGTDISMLILVSDWYWYTDIGILILVLVSGCDLTPGMISSLLLPPNDQQARCSFIFRGGILGFSFLCTIFGCTLEMVREMEANLAMYQRARAYLDNKHALVGAWHDPACSCTLLSLHLLCE